MLNEFSRFDNFKPTPMMTLEDIQSLINEHEFGAHSFMHSSMKYESNNYFGWGMKIVFIQILIFIQIFMLFKMEATTISTGCI